MVIITNLYFIKFAKLNCKILISVQRIDAVDEIKQQQRDFLIVFGKYFAAAYVQTIVASNL